MTIKEFKTIDELKNFVNKLIIPESQKDYMIKSAIFENDHRGYYRIFTEDNYMDFLNRENEIFSTKFDFEDIKPALKLLITELFFEFANGVHTDWHIYLFYPIELMKGYKTEVHIKVDYNIHKPYWNLEKRILNKMEITFFRLPIIKRFHDEICNSNDYKLNPLLHTIDIFIRKEFLKKLKKLKNEER